jgi:YfiH family protein
MAKNNISFISVSSVRSDGSMMRNHILNEKNLQSFLEKYSISTHSLHLMKQIHGKNVLTVSDNVKLFHEGYDGLVTKLPNTFIGVVTGDCVPVTCIDEKAGVIGIVHAGYKGILAGILSEVIFAMKELGSTPENIHIRLGASIGSCCYTIPEDREKLFRKLINNDNIFSYKDDTIHLDLQKSIVHLLRKEGIADNTITKNTECTRCNKEKYFSYRGDTSETFGTFLTIIGMKSND